MRGPRMATGTGLPDLADALARGFGRGTGKRLAAQDAG